VDYDPCSNNGGWQWCAGTGADAQPYFRIFNPWTQSLKHDPQCVYVKRWIPELKEVDKKRILKWYEETSPKEAYPLPIVDHKEARVRALRRYSKIK
jgi:deoxyribodipyrimidine photo-lyase